MFRSKNLKRKQLKGKIDIKKWYKLSEKNSNNNYYEILIIKLFNTISTSRVVFQFDFGYHLSPIITHVIK